MKLVNLVPHLCLASSRLSGLLTMSTSVNVNVEIKHCTCTEMAACMNACMHVVFAVYECIHSIHSICVLDCSAIRAFMMWCSIRHNVCLEMKYAYLKLMCTVL